MIETEKYQYQFETVEGEPIDNVPAYISEKLIHHPDGDVFVGVDSKVKRGHTQYEMVIAIRYPGKGVHIIHCTKKGKKHYKEDLHERLWQEVEYAMDLGVYLRDKLFRLVTIHIDVSPNPENKSHGIYKGAMGMLRGLSVPGRLEYAGKPHSWAAMRAADWQANI